MTKYFIYYLFVPFVVSIVGGGIYSTLTNHDYKSEWFTAEDVISMDITVSFINGLVVALFSILILLNKKEKVRNNFILSFLSWFIFIFSILFIVINHLYQFAKKYNDGIIEDYENLYFLFLPYLLGAIISFVLFRRDLNRNDSLN